MPSPTELSRLVCYFTARRGKSETLPDTPKETFSKEPLLDRKVIPAQNRYRHRGIGKLQERNDISRICRPSCTEPNSEATLIGVEDCAAEIIDEKDLMVNYANLDFCGLADPPFR
jgi:hypothetical protein